MSIKIIIALCLSFYFMGGIIGFSLGYTICAINYILKNIKQIRESIQTVKLT
jgi:hypothetical protein